MKNNKESSTENLENLENSQKPENDKSEKVIPENLIKETFLQSIFRKIIDSGIPIKEVLNAIALGYIIGIISTILWYNYVTTNQLNTHRWIYLIVVGFIILFLSYSIAVR